MSEFDLRYLSLGGGAQSSTMYLLALHGELTPLPDVAIFADTQAEPQWVYDQIDYLEQVGGDKIRIDRPTAGSIEDALRVAVEGDAGRFASIPFWVPGDDGYRRPGRRQCTREYKIDVIKAHARSLMGIKKGYPASGRVRAEEWVGISLDEAHRAKPSRYDWITTRWPLLMDRPMNRSECYVWLREHGYQEPQKSACYFCPYRNNVEWRDIRDNAPELWERACQLDEEMRKGGRTLKGMRGQQYMHKSLVPLKDADLGDDDGQLDLFGNECEGMCGV